MQLLTADMKMAEVVHSNYLLVPVINRFGIPLGFGDGTVKAVCKAHGIDPEFFLTIVNVFNDEEYFPEKTLQGFNVLTVVEYLRRTHSYYIEVQVPLIERHIAALLRRSAKRDTSLKLVRKFFLEYKRELLAHLRREETVTFPYAVTIYRLFRARRRRISAATLSRYSMKVYEEEHYNVDEKLYDLQNILIKYVKGRHDEQIRTAIVFELFRLEKDIKDHTRLEESVLRPVVAEMERAVRSRAR